FLHSLVPGEDAADFRKIADVLVPHDERAAPERQPVLTDIRAAHARHLDLQERRVRRDVRQGHLAQLRGRGGDLDRSQCCLRRHTHLCSPPTAADRAGPRAASTIGRSRGYTRRALVSKILCWSSAVNQDTASRQGLLSSNCRPVCGSIVLTPPSISDANITLSTPTVWTNIAMASKL